MKENELRVLLEEILKESAWDIGISIATVVLTACSIGVAVVVAIIYYKQSKIFEGQRKINEQQLEIQRVELNNKRFESVPNFILSARIFRQRNTNSFQVEQFIIRVPEYSRVKEAQKFEIEVNGTKFPMKQNKNMKSVEYHFDQNYQELMYIQANSNGDIFSVKITVRIITITFDEFETEFLVNLNNGLTDVINEVSKELTYIEK